MPMPMHKFFKKHLFLAVLWIFSQASYCLPYPFSKTQVALLDMAIFQANFGWADLSSSHATLNILQEGIAPVDTHFGSSGLHIALNITDVKRLPSNWFLGGRLGAQVFSNLKDTVYIPTPAIENGTSQAYDLKLPGGFFGDFLAYKTFKRYFGMAFVGVGYDRYMLQGYQNYTSGLPIEIRNNRIWAVGARAGAGAGMQFKGNIMASLEYTHRFKQSMTALANSGNFPYESRYHNLDISGNSLDLTFGVALYD